VADPQELSIAAWALPELVEAAVRSGRPEQAAGALSRLEAVATAGATDWGLGTHALARAVVDGDEDRYREASERLGRAGIRAVLGRAQLLHGEWLRREGRRREAREQLAAAYSLFTGMGAAAFAERARHELLATGATASRRTGVTRDQLTAQETQIARLAQSGLSNPEIAARLFISPRTVQYHLHKVFAKLGINSRSELDRVLETETAPTG
jgi:DNA-binding CsgD family transcriptional regulator